MKTITVIKADKTLKGSITLPSSKSLSNRLLILQQLYPDSLQINNLSEAEDTLLMTRLLREIAGKKPESNYLELDTGNAGTAMRFLTAYLSNVPGKWILRGSERMKQRPIGLLIDALKFLGADIEYLGRIGYPPLMIKGKLLKGGEIRIESGTSSQFISALLLIAPVLPGGLKILLKGEPVSFPYIDMTLYLLKSLGIGAVKERNRIVISQNNGINQKTIKVESDWSSAAFWYEAAALSDDVDLVLEGLQKISFQGDAILADIFRNFGVESEFFENGVRLTKIKKKIDGFYFDFTDYPDLAPAVITSCLAMGLRGRFEGLKNLKIKETDRLQALKTEYRKMGINLDPDSTSDLVPRIEFSPQKFQPVIDSKIDTYNDHRMAMAFAPLAVRFGSIRIENPIVVGKSYPHFWEHMTSVGFVINGY